MYDHVNRHTNNLYIPLYMGIVHIKKRSMFAPDTASLHMFVSVVSLVYMQQIKQITMFCMFAVECWSFLEVKIAVRTSHAKQA